MILRKNIFLPEDNQLFLELIFFKNQNILNGNKDKKPLLLYYEYSQNIFLFMKRKIRLEANFFFFFMKKNPIF